MDFGRLKPLELRFSGVGASQSAEGRQSDERTHNGGVRVSNHGERMALSCKDSIMQTAFSHAIALASTTLSSLARRRAARQVPAIVIASAIAASMVFVVTALGRAEDQPERSVLNVEGADAADEASMKPYIEAIEHTDATIELIPIPGGEFEMGSPADEKDRGDDEGPRHKVKVEPFWMSKCEITWDAYEIWMFDLDVQRRKLRRVEPNARDLAAEEYQVSQPTEPYADMTFGMGKRGYPAICMTQVAARTFCQWLSAKTGRYYRLPTEAEWEYACRAGTTTAYSFGDDVDSIDDYAWYYDNSSEKYHKVGEKKPNPWGLHDMHGNVAEWVLDGYTADFYGAAGDKVAVNPLAVPMKLYPRVVRGGSWDDDPDRLRSAARGKSTDEWSKQDPQFPKSLWYHTDATFVGFRIVRPLVDPSQEEKTEKWEKNLPEYDRKRGRE
jgi:formylglycine-generating enzyme required for sulfatase activity